jgi:uncharacterized protein YbjT (DUF2867 family)
MAIKTIIFGATGMVGEGVLHESLNHSDVESVLVIGRKSCGVRDKKLTELIHADFFDYSTIERNLKGFNACFFCLGVSSVGMKEEAYTRITYGLTMHAARTLSRLNPEMSFSYVSGTGTDSTEHGRSMWARVKGKTENDLMKLPFKNAFMFRPGFIKPTKGLKNAYALSSLLGLLYPILELLFPKYVCTLEDLGIAMIQAAGHGSPKRILENKDIVQLARVNWGGSA